MLNWIFAKKKRQEEAEALYKAAVAASRNPAFYAEYGVPDTLDGRFEMLALHVFFEIERVQGTDPKRAQAIFDVMFKDMDRSARERGVGDLSVPKHIKRMMVALHGRATAYRNALQQPDDVALREAIARNIFGTLDQPEARHVDYFVVYMRARATGAAQTTLAAE